MKNWKEKANHLLDNYKYAKKPVLTAMKEFAKLACEEQKEICADNAECEEVSSGLSLPVDINSILNSPTVKFE